MLAQTTDSGSNKDTKAQEMQNQLLTAEDSYHLLNPGKMHMKCFCHKLALIVGTGLKELGIKAPPPPKVGYRIQRILVFQPMALGHNTSGQQHKRERTLVFQPMVLGHNTKESEPGHGAS
jgi:hypothetical protein